MPKRKNEKNTEARDQAVVQKCDLIDEAERLYAFDAEAAHEQLRQDVELPGER
jgi:hypothetical protein